MTKTELVQAVWELVDENNSELSQEDYLEVLQTIRDEANDKAEVVEQELAGE